MECAQKMHETRGDLHSMTVLKCMSALMDYYMLMTLDDWVPALAKKACLNCCLFYKALADEAYSTYGHDTFWRIKPKLHMFQEMGGVPQFFFWKP